MANSNPCGAIWFMFNLNVRYIMSYNKNKFEHNFKKAREQRKFNEKQKLNNLFGIMANVQKDLFK